MSDRRYPASVVHKERSTFGDVTIFLNGRALYKRWSDGSSVLFESYGPNTTNHDRDRGGYENG